MIRVIVPLLACLAWPAATMGQMVAVEGQQAFGVSTESVRVAATQLRALGEVGNGLRFEVEGAFGTEPQQESDAFGTAYPYSGRADLIQAYAEYFLRPGYGLRSVKAGRYRTPFGISAASEHAYMGFLRPPLIRYGEYFALSSGYLEHGVDLVIGAPKVSAELSVGRPGDVGEAIRRPGTDMAMRIEGSLPSLIVGASFLDTTPYLPAQWARGRSRFGGLDVRWMQGGVQVRGEWLRGQPFEGTSTAGGYADVIVHRPGMGPVTALARVERLDYETDSPFALHSHRYHGGVRVRVWQGLAASVGAVYQGGQLTQHRRTALDLGVSYSVRKDF